MGKLFNETGERLTPSYAIKQGVRYRYYISTSAMQARDRAASATHRLPAPALEAAVIDALRSAIEKPRSSETEVGSRSCGRSRDTLQRLRTFAVASANLVIRPRRASSIPD